MLNDICSLGLSTEQLAGYAARLGSDCAFFIFGRPMFGAGRGEVLTPFELAVDIVDAGGADCSGSRTGSSIAGNDSSGGGNDSSGTGIACPCTGEHPEKGRPQYELQIVIPEGISVSTAEAYRGITPAIPEMRLKDVLARPVSEWKDLLVNDFEATVFKAHPELAAIKQSLYDSGAIYASMSGSGSALFALYERR